MLGSGSCTIRSKRPGRVNAVSRADGRLVAAITTTPVLSSKPSISVRSWLMVCTDSSLPPPPMLRCLPRPSNSSMKRMQGACAQPCDQDTKVGESEFAKHNLFMFQLLCQVPGTLTWLCGGDDTPSQPRIGAKHGSNSGC